MKLASGAAQDGRRYCIADHDVQLLKIDADCGHCPHACRRDERCEKGVLEGCNAVSFTEKRSQHAPPSPHVVSPLEWAESNSRPDLATAISKYRRPMRSSDSCRSW